MSFFCFCFGLFTDRLQSMLWIKWVEKQQRVQKMHHSITKPLRPKSPIIKVLKMKTVIKENIFASLNL